MKRIKFLIVGLLLVLGLQACRVTFYGNHSYRNRSRTPSNSEVFRVVCYEYFDCTNDEYIYLQGQGFDHCEVFTILFLTRTANVDVRFVVKRYRIRRDFFIVATEDCRLKRNVFFISFPRTTVVRQGPPFGRAYGHYKKNHSTFTLNRIEIFALVDLHILVDYYGYDSQQAIRIREQNRGINVFVKHHHRMGMGNKNIRKRTVKRTKHPWKIRHDKKRPTYKRPRDKKNPPKKDKIDKKKDRKDYHRPKDKKKPKDKIKKKYKDNKKKKSTKNKVKTKKNKGKKK